MFVNLLRQSWVALKVLVVMTVLLGVAYPFAIYAAGRASDSTADGSLLRVDGRVVGSSLIGQNFPVADDEWFHSRPSAGDYDGLASAPSNLAPSNPDLAAARAERRAAVAKVEGVAPSAVPEDALAASASGLDPHISPAYAALQIPRVAAARGLSESEVRRLVDRATEGRQLGFLGEPRVNVLELNASLPAR